MLKHKFKEAPLYQTHIKTAGLTLIDGVEGDEMKLPNIWRLAHVSKCPFCANELVEIDKRIYNGERKGGFCINFLAKIVACLVCGWWRYESSKADEMMAFDDLAIGSILSGTDAKYWAPVPAIRAYLKANPSYLRTGLSPIALEQVMRDVFSEYYNCEVHWTGTGSDGGFDLYHVLADGCSTLYQIKRRQSSNKSESVIPIRELLGTMIIRNAINGIYVTTADSFSKVAVDEASMARHNGYILKLVDYKRLIDILRSTSPGNNVPWSTLWETACKDYLYYKRTFPISW